MTEREINLDKELAVGALQQKIDALVTRLSQAYPRHIDGIELYGADLKTKLYEWFNKYGSDPYQKNAFAEIIPPDYYVRAAYGLDDEIIRELADDFKKEFGKFIPTIFQKESDEPRPRTVH